MAADYVSQVRTLGWEELEQLWTKIAQRDTPGWSAGMAFEHLVLRSFELNDARVVWPYEVRLNGQILEQIDGLVAFDHFVCLIEAKDEANPVNVEPIAKLRNQLMRRPAGVLGSVFSFAGFTDPAKTLAQYTAPQAILLWNGYEMPTLLKTRRFKETLGRKFEFLVQMGIPDFDTRWEAAA